MVLFLFLKRALLTYWMGYSLYEHKQYRLIVYLAINGLNEKWNIDENLYLFKS